MNIYLRDLRLLQATLVKSENAANGAVEEAAGLDSKGLA